MGVWYSTREAVKRALDSKETARNNAQVDRAIEAASRGIDLLCHRRFYPQIATRYFDWPSAESGVPWRLWLDANEVVSVSSLVSGSAAITAFNLEPNGYGPPYSRIEIQRDSDFSFGNASTSQRDIAVTGTFGYTTETRPAGALESAIASTSTTSITVTDGGTVGVGSLLLIDSEYLRVTEKAFVTTGLTMTTGLSSSKAGTDLTLSGSGVNVGETLRVDNEWMLVVDADGTDVTVRRAWDGSPLDAHSLGATVYAMRLLTVERGAVGSTAATHGDAAAVAAHVVPAAIESLCISEAIELLTQHAAANTKDAVAMANMREWAYDLYGRKNRKRVVR